MIPQETDNFIRSISRGKKSKYLELRSLAFIIGATCKNKFSGTNEDYYKYLNKSIKNKIRDSRRKKRIKLTPIDKDIEDYGYEQPNNVFVYDFLKYVEKNCSNKCYIFLKTYLTQDSSFRIYMLKNINKKRKLDYNLVFDYLNYNYKERGRIIKELGYARRRY